MRRSDVQFKAKVEDALFAEAPVIEAKAVRRDSHRRTRAPIPEVSSAYPYDGQPIWLTPDGVEAHPATWRTTRAYEPVESNGSLTLIGRGTTQAASALNLSR
jgi:hypothetical protein